MSLEPIDPARYRCIVALTGAGISVASGLQPYRGPGGLWEQRPEHRELATIEALQRDSEAVWRLFSAMREAARAAEPSRAHVALAHMEARAREVGSRVVVITQNVDGLHQRAGSREVVELHGSLSRSRCARCDRPALDVATALTTPAPRCERCGATLRPDVVLFGEYPDVDDEHRAKLALRECDLFIAIGTSGTVAPASSYVRWAEVNGARTILVNVEAPRPPNPAFREVLLGRAEDIVPALAGG